MTGVMITGSAEMIDEMITEIAEITVTTIVMTIEASTDAITDNKLRSERDVWSRMSHKASGFCFLLNRIAIAG